MCNCIKEKICLPLILLVCICLNLFGFVAVDGVPTTTTRSSIELKNITFCGIISAVRGNYRILESNVELGEWNEQHNPKSGVTILDGEKFKFCTEGLPGTKGDIRILETSTYAQFKIDWNFQSRNNAIHNTHNSEESVLNADTYRLFNKFGEIGYLYLLYIGKPATENHLYSEMTKLNSDEIDEN